MTIGIILISPPVLTLYDAGLFGGSPAGPMTFISVVALALSVVFSLSVWAVLHAYCDYEEERSSDSSPAVERQRV